MFCLCFIKEFLMLEATMIGEFLRSPSEIQNILSLLGLYRDDYIELRYIQRIRDAMYLGEPIRIFGCLQGHLVVVRT